MTVYTTLPTDDLNLAVTVIDDPDLVKININPAQVTGSGGALGTVTNVATGTGLTGGPITTNGTIAIDSTVATLDGAQALTNKTGLISQWTNDAGYLTGSVSQTLSFTTPDISISGGNSVDLSALTTTSLAFSAITSTPTTVAGYGITDAFDGVYSSLTGKPTLFSGAYADLSGKPTIPTNNNQLTNGAGYTTNTGTVTPTSTDTFTNKSGNISQWTNDAGYITSETDNQTLSFANPNLSISSGNSVDLSALTPTSLAWSAITSTPTTLSGYGITDAFSGAYADLTGKPTIPTQTVINNNADNRVITGSATADNLNGETGLTFDGAKMEVQGTAAGVNDAVLNLKTDNSGWNRPTLMAEDSNGKVFSQVGQLNTGANYYQYNITLDPDNNEPRTNVGGNGNTYAGDYFVGIEKNFNDTDNIAMDMKVFGANAGFNLRVFDDNNGGVSSYGLKPFNVYAQEMIVEADGTRALDVLNNGIKFFDSYEFPTSDGNANQVLTTDGAGNITFQDAGGLAASTTPTLTGAATAFQGLNYVVTVSNYNSAYVPGSQFRLEITKDSDSSVISTPQDFTDNGDGTFTVTIPGSAAVGAHTVRVKAQDFNKGSSAETTMSLTISAISFTKRYWRLKDFDGGPTGSAGNTSIQIMEFQLFSSASQAGTKYPSNMTSNTAPTPFVASGQGYYAPSGDTYNYFRAFDGNAGNSFYWNLAGDMSTDYLAIDLGSAQTIESFSFTSGSTASSAGKFALFHATQSDFSDEELVQRFEFTTGTQTITFG